MVPVRNVNSNLEPSSPKLGHFGGKKQIPLCIAGRLIHPQPGPNEKQLPILATDETRIVGLGPDKSVFYPCFIRG